MVLLELLASDVDRLQIFRFQVLCPHPLNVVTYKRCSSRLGYYVCSLFLITFVLKLLISFDVTLKAVAVTMSECLFIVEMGPPSFTVLLQSCNYKKITKYFPTVNGFMGGLNILNIHGF